MKDIENTKYEDYTILKIDHLSAIFYKDRFLSLEEHYENYIKNKIRTDLIDKIIK